jgi:hypothetical protein
MKLDDTKTQESKKKGSRETPMILIDAIGDKFQRQIEKELMCGYRGREKKQPEMTDQPMGTPRLVVPISDNTIPNRSESI